jgi:hypothetical protein
MYVLRRVILNDVVVSSLINRLNNITRGGHAENLI